MTRVLTLALLAGALAGAAFAEAAADNGIRVGEPKLFDARALFLMLEELEGQLARIRPIDPEKVAGAVGAFQGGRRRELQVGVSAVGRPAPAVDTTLAPDTESGELEPTGATVERPQQTAAVPELPDLAQAPAASPLGLHAQDLLSDQVSLTYQIFSLRLLLERALSDRLLGSGEPRQQAILGFRVNLDPPHRARRKAAFVEITVAPKGGGALAPEGLSVVGLMPQEKVYNASSVTTKAGAFGGAALAGVFSLGVNVKKANQVFYLYRDSDTISFPRLPNPPDVPAGAVTFGWQFRPVLGRTSVSSEPRQLMAILALPRGDVGDDDPLELEAHVRTYWTAYRSRAQTRSRRAHLERGSERLGSVRAWKSAWAEDRLTPTIRDVDWSVIGPDRALVTVRGQNLLPGTRVLLGDRVHEESSGLVLKSDQTLEFVTSLTALATQEGRLSGRFGPSARLERRVPDADGVMQFERTEEDEGIFMNQIRRGPTRDRELVSLALVVQERRGRDLEPRPGLEPLVAIQGVPVPGPYKVSSDRCEALDYWNPDARPTPKKCLLVEAVVPAASLREDVRVSVNFPLRGKAWFASEVLEHTAQTIRVERLGGRDRAVLVLHGWAFDDEWTVLLDRAYAPGVTGDVELELVDKNLMLLRAPTAFLDQYPRLGVRNPATGRVDVLAVPGFRPPSPRATLAAGQVASAARDSAVAVTFRGENLAGVSGVLFDGEALRFAASATELRIFLTRRVTAEPGDLDLLVEGGGGERLVARVRVTG